MDKSDIIKLCVFLLFATIAGVSLFTGGEHRTSVEKVISAQETLMKAGESGIKSASKDINEAFKSDPSVGVGLNYYVVRGLFSKKKYKDAIKLAKETIRRGGITEKVEQSLEGISVYSQYNIDAKKDEVKATDNALKALDALLRRDKNNPDCLVLKGVFLLNKYEFKIAKFFLRQRKL